MCFSLFSAEREGGRGERRRGQAIPYAIIRERIVQSCKLLVEKNSKDGGVTIVESRPLKWLVDSIYERGNYGGKIKPLAGIIESPTIRADGSILQTPGWDEATGLIYRPNAEYPHITSINRNAACLAPSIVGLSGISGYSAFGR